MKALFTAALWLQILWFALALSYNCLSPASMAAGGPGFAGGWATTISALLAVAVFGTVTLTGFMLHKTLYRLFSPLVVVILLVGGVLKHMMLGPVPYASYGHWLAAILINAFGVAAFALGASLAFSRTVNTAD